MVEKIRCAVADSDWVKAEPYPRDREVVISFSEGDNVGNICLTPTDARKLRKQIKKALEAIEGVEDEAAEEPKTNPRFPDWFQPGAIVAITDNNNDHHFKIGEKVRVGRG